VWALPVTLAATRAQAAAIHEGDDVALTDSRGSIVGVMSVTEKFEYDRVREAERCFGTTDAAHPGVARVYAQGEVYLGGPVWVLERPNRHLFSEFRLTPLEARRRFDELGWKTVAGFQTRNPVHRAHEYLQKCAMEVVDGLLLHPLVGETKGDDVPAAVRMRTYEAILRAYYPASRAMLAVFPAAMRYAGPREAVWHAICRKNYGCTHFIVGRDHAGVGSYYGSYDAQLMMDRYSHDELGIVPLKFDHAFYCRACGNMASAKTCPHDADVHLHLSGTSVRAMLAGGELPPAELTRPEVASILADAYRQAPTAAVAALPSSHRAPAQAHAADARG
jgi:ATP sulfurylase